MSPQPHASRFSDNARWRQRQGRVAVFSRPAAEGRARPQAAERGFRPFPPHRASCPGRAFCPALPSAPRCIQTGRAEMGPGTLPLNEAMRRLSSFPADGPAAVTPHTPFAGAASAPPAWRPVAPWQNALAAGFAPASSRNRWTASLPSPPRLRLSGLSRKPADRPRPHPGEMRHPLESGTRWVTIMAIPS